LVRHLDASLSWQGLFWIESNTTQRLPHVTGVETNQGKQDF
jgi:hypothetical protein